MSQNLDLLPSGPQGYLTVTEVARRCGVKRETVRRWILRDKLPGVVKQASGGRQGWRFLVPVGSLERMEASRASNRDQTSPENDPALD